VTSPPVNVPLPPLRTSVRLFRFRAVLYVAQVILRNLIFSAAPLVSGLIVREFFETLSGHSPAGLNPWTLAALMVIIAVGRSSLILADITIQNVWLVSIMTLLRKNMLTRILERPGARAVP
jgi:ATP-binding cassette subfamily B protein